MPIIPSFGYNNHIGNGSDSTYGAVALVITFNVLYQSSVALGVVIVVAVFFLPLPVITIPLQIIRHPLLVFLIPHQEYMLQLLEIEVSPRDRALYQSETMTDRMAPRTFCMLQFCFCVRLRKYFQAVWKHCRRS